MKNSMRWMVSLIAWATVGCFLPSAPAQDKDIIEAGSPKVLQIAGTIVKMDEKSIVVKTEKGERELSLNAKTRYGTKLDKIPKTASDFKEGDSVLVFFEKGKDSKGSFTARAITPYKI